MNKLTLPGTVWIASDIHLGEHNPGTAAVFLHFLERARREADALILCGDVFEAWIGDDHALHNPPDWLSGALEALRDTARGIPLWLGRGNRDFLMGAALARSLGAQLLDDEVLLSTAAGTALLAHGDQYCTDDIGYQRLRRVVRTAWVQCAFLALPLALRRRIAAWARARSHRARAMKTMRIMDVNPQAVERALAAAGCSVLIHGHTHRPGMHELNAGGRACRRFVLPDWDHDQPPRRGGWLVLDAGGPRLVLDES
ncbi:UDP-2,3-diacylglucosamine diphosphatase [Castellaniella sp. GW247-6E4]|uniref:UDP-2,3-diacylglucosamine diphosphatase n=1 Tax=Castellaniella sp. GW247-6E4 TaxID=3140380 RepID=UPI003315EC12